MGTLPNGRTLMIVLVALCFADATPGSEAPVNDVDRELDAMVDALANRINTAPEIIGEGPRSPLIFHEDYDYAEQLRVFRVAKELSKRNGNELWPRLVARLGDERYAFTYESGDGGPVNETVGHVCEIIAAGDLELAYERISPVEVHLGVDVHLVRGPDLVGDALTKWCQARKGKQLFEMQVDILDWTLTHPEALEELSPDQRDEYIQKTRMQIDSLRKTRKPLVDKERFNTGYFNLYSAKQIKALEEKFRKTQRKSKKKKDDNSSKE